MKLRAEIVLKNAKIVPQGHHVTSGSRSNRKNPKILKVLLNSQFSRYRRKILYTETCTQALADGIANHRHFHHLTWKLRSRSFSHNSQYLIYLMSYQAVSYTHLRAHETDSYLVCRLLLEKK